MAAPGFITSAALLAANSLALNTAGDVSFLSNIGVTATVALVPFIAIAGTSFIKIALVLAIIRSALGAPGIIPAPILLALSAILSLFVMIPVGQEMGVALESLAPPPQAADDPFGFKQAKALYDAVSPPLLGFLKSNTPPGEIAYFQGLAGTPGDPAPGLRVLLPAFAIGEVTEAFVIGFLIFIPFLVIDLIVSNTLVALGMPMLSPLAVSLPLKLLLFTVVDGWHVVLDALLVTYGY